MAMTFTLVSHLREELLALVKRRVERQIEEEKEKERRALEVSHSYSADIGYLLMTFILIPRKRKREQEAPQ